MGIGGDEVIGAGVEVGEVAAASAGDEDLAAGQAAAFEQGYAAAALGGDGGAHQTRGAGAEDDGVEYSSRRHLQIRFLKKGVEAGIPVVSFEQ